MLKSSQLQFCACPQCTVDWSSYDIYIQLLLLCVDAFANRGYWTRSSKVICAKHQFPWSNYSVQLLSRVKLFVTPWTAAPRLPCPSPTPGARSNSCPSSWWCHPTILSSVVPFFSHLQTFPASGTFQMSQLFLSGGQSTGVSASTSVLPMNSQDWSPLGWTGWLSLQSKGLPRVFSNTTVQKHQLFSVQLSL